MEWERDYVILSSFCQRQRYRHACIVSCHLKKIRHNVLPLRSLVIQTSLMESPMASLSTILFAHVPCNQGQKLSFIFLSLDELCNNWHFTLSTLIFSSNIINLKWGRTRIKCWMLNTKFLYHGPGRGVLCCDAVCCVVHVFVESRLLLVENTRPSIFRLSFDRDRVKNLKKITDRRTHRRTDWLPGLPVEANKNDNICRTLDVDIFSVWRDGYLNLS